MFGLDPTGDVEAELSFHLEMRTRELLDRARHGDGIVVVDGLLGEVALVQPHDTTAADVDRGVQVEVHVRAHAAQRLTKFFSSSIPFAPDFSGWNCAAITCSRSTTDAKRSPYSEVPTTSDASDGRQANECTW